MCTRYSLHDQAAFRKILADLGLAFPPALTALYNIALTTRAPVVTRQRGKTELTLSAFGLVLPPKEAGGKTLTLANARSETMLAKSSFRDAVQHRRCLIPADGFYEWEKLGRARQPHYFQRRDGAPFFFAGLWRAETTISPSAFVIVTTHANPLLAPIHDRMPVMLTEATAPDWLGDEPLPPRQLDQLCVPFSAADMRTHLVSPRMNSARHEGPDCIAPFAPPPPEPTLFD